MILFLRVIASLGLRGRGGIVESVVYSRDFTLERRRYYGQP